MNWHKLVIIINDNYDNKLTRVSSINNDKCHHI